MRKIKVKVPLKVNLSLDLVGTKKGYHLINSIVTTINVYDTITLKKREDKKITLTQQGVKVDCDVAQHSSYKSALEFINNFDTNGVDIFVKKKIGAGAGLGGSSADIVGTIRGLENLYGIKTNIFPLLNKLGSDTAYMYNGGWALIQGFGEKLEPINISTKLYFNLFTIDESCSSKQAYSTFDQLNISETPVSKTIKEHLKAGEIDLALALVKNDLYKPASLLVPEIKNAVDLLEKECVVMSGSGSTVITIHQTKQERNAVYKKYKKSFAGKIVKAESI